MRHDNDDYNDDDDDEDDVVDYYYYYLLWLQEDWQKTPTTMASRKRYIIEMCVFFLIKTTSVN